MRLRQLPVFFLGLALLSLTACGGAQARRAKHMEKGQIYLAAGNLDKARVEFQNALQITPTDPEARFENGVVDEKLGKRREAAQYYQGAIDVAPNHVGARTRLARLYVFSGLPEKALELMSPIVEAHPDDADILTVRAAARQQQNDAAGALADAERAVKLAPANEDAVAVLAGLYAAQGAAEKARQLLEESIKRIPLTVDLRLVLAQIYSSENRRAEAEALLVDLVRLQPKDTANRIRLAQYYVLADQLDAAEKTLRQALVDLPNERAVKFALVDFLAAHRSREAAETQLKTMLAADPKDAELKFALARFYESNKQAASAELIYHSVIDQDKFDAAGLSARDRLASLRVQAGDTAGALALIKEVLEKSPRDDDALILRGNIALGKQDPKSAIADLRSVLRDQPNALGVLRTLALAHVQNGEPAIAEEVMRHAVEADPKNPDLRLAFAQLLLQIDKPDQAIAMLAEVVKQQPDNIAALDTQFRAAMATKDWITARTDAQSLVAIRPKAAVGYLYEGAVAEAAKHPDEALQLYRKAVDVQPETKEPLEAQIRLLVEMKRVPEALARLDEIAALVPTDPIPLNLKGTLLLNAVNLPDAMAAFKAAIARAPAWWAPYRGVAAIQMAEKHPDEAIATMRSAEPTVDQPELLGAELAALLVRTNHLEDAIAEYESLIQRYPRSELAANNLAMLLASYKTDHVSLARAKELSVRFANSPNPSLLDTYGWVLYKCGETAASVPVLQRVVEKSPDAVVARYHLGMAQSQTGDVADARENLSRAVNSGSQFAGLDEAKATLNKMAKLPATASVGTKSYP